MFCDVDVMLTVRAYNSVCLRVCCIGFVSLIVICLFVSCVLVFVGVILRIVVF